MGSYVTRLWSAVPDECADFSIVWETGNALCKAVQNMFQGYFLQKIPAL